MFCPVPPPLVCQSPALNSALTSLLSNIGASASNPNASPCAPAAAPAPAAASEPASADGSTQQLLTEQEGSGAGSSSQSQAGGTTSSSKQKTSRSGRVRSQTADAVVLQQTLCNALVLLFAHAQTLLLATHAPPLPVTHHCPLGLSLCAAGGRTVRGSCWSWARQCCHCCRTSRRQGPRPHVAATAGLGPGVTCRGSSSTWLGVAAGGRCGLRGGVRSAAGLCLCDLFVQS